MSYLIKHVERQYWLNMAIIIIIIIPLYMFKNCLFITAHICSLQEGNVYSHVCLSVCSQGLGPQVNTSELDEVPSVLLVGRGV